MPHTENDNVYEDCGLRGLALLDKIIELIEEHPESWNQRHWAKVSVGEFNQETREYVPATCGTAYCVAGWAVHMAGYQLKWRPIWEDYRSDVPDHFAASYCKKPGEGWDYADSRGSISEVARELLEIDWEMGERLFEQFNTLDDIKRIREEIAEEVMLKRSRLAAAFGNV